MHVKDIWNINLLYNIEHKLHAVPIIFNYGKTGGKWTYLIMENL